MKILVTGTRGQLATSLFELGAKRPGVEVLAMGRPEIDLARPEAIAPAVLAARPDVVVSAAAYTAVDRAEGERDLAYTVNVLGAAAVAGAAARLAIPIIHLSTDYVFAGDARRAYREGDATGPKSHYGHTKLEGERAVAAANPYHFILRTSWVYSPFGTNFAKTMLRLAQDRPAVSVVSDQWGNPTSALDLADAILRVAERPAREHSGLYHVAGSGETNWSGFARHIFEVSRANGGPFAFVHDIASSEYPRKARRPLNSRLSTQKFEKTFGWRSPDWQQSAETIVRRIVKARRPVLEREGSHETRDAG